MEESLQAAIQAINSEVADDNDNDQQLIAAKCRALMVGYHRQWALALWEIVSVEEVFHSPIVNPQTGAASRTFTLAGKFDGIIQRDEEGYLLEHKTTSEEIADPSAAYWHRLAVDSQISVYLLANWQAERGLHGTVYDVVRKPTIRPRRLSSADKKEIRDCGIYHGLPVSGDCADLEAESIKLYELRLTADVLERPERYFQRRIIPRLDDELLEFASELWDVSKSLLEARSQDRHYRNDVACRLYGSTCEYLPLCAGHDSIDSDNWQFVENVHRELPLLTEDAGRSVLANSRIRCFKTCRRQHYLRYELGVRGRDDEQEPDALYFGRLWHTAQEAWWSCFMKGADDDNRDDATEPIDSPPQTELVAVD